MVVGHSEQEMDKIGNPYYMFKLIQKLKDVLPNWMPLIGVEGGHFNVVPVDFGVALESTSPTSRTMMASVFTSPRTAATAWANSWTLLPVPPRPAPGGKTG